MRILFLTQWFHPEPGAIRGLPLARELQQGGDRVEVLTGFPNYPGGHLYAGYRLRPRFRETLDGVPVLRVPLYPSHDASALGRVLNYSSFALSAATLGLTGAGRADVGYVYHPPPTVGLAALAFRHLRRLPFVYHIADMWPESLLESGMAGGPRTRRAVEAVVGAWCRSLYRQASQVTVLSPGFQRLLVERGVPADKIHIIYNWVEEEVFRPLPRDPELARSLGLQDTFNVVYAGNIGAYQGIDTLVRAAAHLADLPSVRMVIAGTGQKLAEVKSLAASLNLTNVVFLGRREYWEMPHINALADVLVVHLRDLPFFAATIPSKTQVALACGRPVVMAVRGDSADLVRQAEAGLTCEPENPEALARAVRQLHALSPERRARLGDNGRRYYQEHLSLAEGTRRMRELLHAVGDRRGRRHA